MKKSLLFWVLTVFATVTMAQTNLKPGYVITNSGDTIRGNIDFRTNDKLSKQCDFWANGGNVKTTYKPGDIEGFRFGHNGKYFVTRRLNVTGEPELYFAEFMVHGKMNLYCIVHNSDEYYFFEREDGEMAELTKRSSAYSSVGSFAIQEAKDHLQEKREQFGKVKSLLQKSWKAVEGVDDNNMSRKKLVNVVRDYHNDVCTDAGKCMVYEYNETSDKFKMHFKVLAGFASYLTEESINQNYSDENYPCGVFEIGIGGEVELERIMKGLSAELAIIYSPKYKSEQEFVATEMPPLGDVSSTIEKSILAFSLGVLKRWGTGNIQPLIRGGLYVGMDLGAKETDMVRPPYASSYYPHDYDLGSYSNHFGFYFGAGVQMPIGKQFVRLHGDLYKSVDITDMVKLGVTAEFGF
ncbi:MAG: hypothetical protein J5735_07445 [Prevotella sp.]|nr:hypothetical protein [Prevotella sp.]